MTNERFNPKFKIDTDALQVGSIIPTTQLIDLTRLTPTSRRWDSKLQAVCKYIEAQRSDLVAAVRRDCVVILTADESAEAVTKSMSKAIASTVTIARKANDPVRMSIHEMSPEIRRGFESVARTSAALAESVSRIALANERLAGLLASDSEPDKT